MKQIPILFSTAMVQAILAGRKTETRRVVKPQPPEQFSNFGKAIAFITDKTLNHTVHCPYGQPGDVLWVRESFQRLMIEPLGDKLPKSEWPLTYLFKASELHLNTGDEDEDGNVFRWKPSIHMPKAAARIWLQVEEVKLERLQDITIESAIAEGIEYSHIDGKGLGYKVYGVGTNTQQTAIPMVSFCTLWQSINGYGSWAANPYVWVIKFKVLSTEGKPTSLIS